MSNLKDKALICKDCGSAQVKVVYGEDERYPDDYSIECLNCPNWEEGNGRPYSFTVLDEPVKNREVIEMAKRPDTITCEKCGSTDVTAMETSEGLWVLECQECSNWEEEKYNEITNFSIVENNLDKWEKKLRENRGSLIDNLVTECTKVTLEPMVNEEIFNINSIGELINELKKALMSEYDQIVEERLQEAQNRKVYLLNGANVVGVLEDLQRHDLATDPDMLEKIVDEVDHRLELPWSEYVEAIVDKYIENERI